MWIRAILALVVLISGSGAVAGSNMVEQCGRECLISRTDQFLDALVTHDPPGLALSENARSTLNGAAIPLDSPDWAVIDAIAYHQYVPDPTNGQVAFFGVAEEQERRGAMFLRLKFEHSELTEIELVLGERTDDGVPGLISPNPLFNYVLPPSQRRDRAALVSIADSYFEGLERHDGSGVPITPDCRRFENGVQTTLNPVFIPIPCNDFAPFTYMDRTANRSYPVVDEERGLVLGQMVIEVSTPKGPPATSDRRVVNPISGMVMPPSDMRSKPRNTIIRELFKVVDGRIMEIQTVRLDVPYGAGDGWE